MPSRVGALGLRERGGAVVATRDEGIALLDLATGRLEPLARPRVHGPPGQFNDGKVDRRGRFWVGWLTDSRQEFGTLYRVDADGTCASVVADVTGSNGLGWSPDGGTFYYTDSTIGTVWACDFDAERGTVANKRRFIGFPRKRGIPDGLTVDADGFVWIALYNGWTVLRCDPGGAVVSEIRTPVQLPTSCIFGGPDLDILFVTSAVRRLTAENLAAAPLAGALFAIDAGVLGVPEPYFAA